MKNIALAAALLAGISLPSLAQSQSNPPAAASSEKAEMTKLSTPHWRASKLVGVDIYNEQNEKLGDINEIILDGSGKVLGYVIGVGGFLGMGEHDIFVEPTKVKFVNEPLRSAAAPAGNAKNTDSTMTTRPASNTAAGTARAANEIWYPDHGVLSATKDQLKAMPQFKYSSYN